VKKRSKYFWLFYCIFIFAFVLFGTEGLVRIMNWAPPLPRLNYSSDFNFVFMPVPGAVRTGPNKTNEFSFERKHNSLGFRDTEHDFSKKTNSFRILGLGDSFTYGIGAAFEDTYLRQLEKLLNNRTGNYPTIEIIKGGVPRSFPEHQKKLLKYYAAKFKPDLILIGFTPNDIADTYFGLEAVTVSKNGYLLSDDAQKIGDVGMWLYLNCHSCRIVLQFYMGILKKRIPKFQSSAEHHAFFEPSWKKVEKTYEEMMQLADELGSKIVFVHIPQNNKDREYSPQRLLRWSKKRNAFFINVLPAMREASKKQELYWPLDAHCNAEGYKIIARTIFSELTSKKLVP